MKHKILIKNPLFQNLKIFRNSFILLLFLVIDPKFIYDFVLLIKFNESIYIQTRSILYAVYVKDPPLGRRIRPDGALMMNPYEDDLKEKIIYPFGMPSGHSCRIFILFYLSIIT